jgi:opine dehydrogenase
MGSMSSSQITVAGGGACAQGLAVYLLQQGHRVRILEHPDFVANVEPLIAGRPIKYRGVLGEGEIGPERVSTVAADVIPGSRWIFLTVPAYGHDNFARILAPVLEDGQILVANPGPALGAFALRHLLEKYGCTANVTLMETHSTHTSGTLVAPGEVQIGPVPGGVLFSALPATETALHADEFQALIPRTKPASNVLELAFESWNIIAHCAPMVLNAGRIEYAKGEYRHYTEGISESVGRVMDEQDVERLAAARALGLDLKPHKEIVSTLLPYGDQPTGESPRGLYEAYQTPKLYGSTGPGWLGHRYLTEDVPFGLVAWVSIGQHIGVPMPVSEAICRLAGYLMGVDYLAGGRTLENLGLSVHGADDLLALANGA